MFGTLPAVGYRGKVEAQAKARELRAEGRTVAAIAAELGVAKSSVSLWVRDVPYVPQPRQPSPHRRVHPQHMARLAEIEECDELGAARIGALSDQAFLAAGAALYAGEGAKHEHGCVYVSYHCSRTHRQIMGLVRALLSSSAIPG